MRNTIVYRASEILEAATLQNHSYMLVPFSLKGLATELLELAYPSTMMPIRGPVSFSMLIAATLFRPVTSELRSEAKLLLAKLRG